MRSQPRAKKRPKSLYCIDMNFTESVAVFIACEPAFAVTDTFTSESPLRKPVINPVFIRIYDRTSFYSLSNDRFNRCLFHILKHPDNHISASFNQPGNRRLFFLKSSSSSRTFQAVPPSLSLFFFPLRPDFLYGPPRYTLHRFRLLPQAQLSVSSP